MTTQTIEKTRTIDEILAEIESKMAAPAGDSLAVGEQQYTMLQGADAIATMLGGKGKGSEYGKRTDMDRLVLALEGLNGPAAVLVPTTGGELDEQGFMSVTTYASQFVTRAGRLAVAGEIKAKKGKGLKYTAELRIAPPALVEQLPKAPTADDVKAARGVIATLLVAQGLAIDIALDQIDESVRDLVATAYTVRTNANAYARLKLIQGTVAMRWY